MTTKYKDATIKYVIEMLGENSMKASIANISDHKMWLWFTNGAQLRLARPKTIAGKSLEIGQLITISVEKKAGRHGYYDKYIFDGMNNATIEKPQTKKQEKLKIEPLKNFNLGFKTWEITKICDNYLTFSVGTNLRKIRRPYNPSWQGAQIKVGDILNLKIVSKPTSNNKNARWLVYVNKEAQK